MDLEKRVEEYVEDIKPNKLYGGVGNPINTQGKDCFFLSVKPFLKQRLLVFWGQDPRQVILALMVYRHSDASV